MSSTISKRSQARNERAIQELIRTVPGNDRCADCQARNPGWASWSLGIFLCMRCAALHRKLGTHVSKVKSLSMDSWSTEQVEHMKRNGNLSSNRTYNPQNAKPTIPFDVDEVDSTMERFLRQKYEQKVFSGGTARPVAHQYSGSTRSSEEQPPPLPPKPSKRFGFGLRAASSTFPLSRTARVSPPDSPDGDTGFATPPSPIRVNKQSRVFGASVGSTGEAFESKLGTLRDMGFPDEKRNSAVLKGLNGNLERAVETLVRLGEGNGPPSRARTPLPPRSTSYNDPFAVDRPPIAGSPVQSNNPFDQPAAGPQMNNQPIHQPAPEPKQSNGDYVLSPQGQTNSYNPFDAPSQVIPPPQTFEQTFEQLRVSQPLFPHATGGYPSQQQQLQFQQARFQQSMTPPVPQMPQQYSLSSYTQQQQPPLGHYNPFFQSAQQPSPNPYVTQQQLPAPTNSHAYQPHNQNVFSMQSQPGQPLPQSQSQPQQQPQQQQQQQFFSSYAHHYAPPTISQPPYQQQQPQSQPQPQPQLQPQLQPFIPQHTARFDKTSILALYNYPHLAPAPFQHPSISTPSSDPTNTTNPHDQPHPPIPKLPPGVPAPQHAQRSVTMPATLAAGSRNPFLPTTAAAGGGLGALVNDDGGGGGAGRPPASGNGNGNGNRQAGNSRHVSQESVDVGGWQSGSGRHSPDAFAGLSARFVR